MKRYIFDLDGTLCFEGGTFERAIAKPIPENIDILNQLYDYGNEIWIYTARSWAEQKLTEHWLKENGVRHHYIMFGKPIADVWVDDRGINPLRNNLKELLK